MKAWLGPGKTEELLESDILQFLNYYPQLKKAWEKLTSWVALQFSISYNWIKSRKCRNAVFQEAEIEDIATYTQLKHNKIWDNFHFNLLLDMSALQ